MGLPKWRSWAAVRWSNYYPARQLVMTQSVTWHQWVGHQQGGCQLTPAAIRQLRGLTAALLRRDVPLEVCAVNVAVPIEQRTTALELVEQLGNRGRIRHVPNMHPRDFLRDVRLPSSALVVMMVSATDLRMFLGKDGIFGAGYIFAVWQAKRWRRWVRKRYQLGPPRAL